MSELGNFGANLAAENVIKLPPIELRKPGRPKGSRNRRTLLGQQFLRSICPKAKKRLRAIIDGGDDELAMKAASLVLAYTYGRPVQAAEISGPDGAPIGGEPPLDDAELGRRVALLLSRADPSRAEAVSGARSNATAAGPSTPTNGAAAPQRVADGDHGKVAAEPLPPRTGKIAVVGSYCIECREPQRVGLPPWLVVTDEDGRVLTGVVGGWEGALSWCREKLNDPDATWRITRPPKVARLTAAERAALDTRPGQAHACSVHRACIERATELR